MARGDLYEWLVSTKFAQWRQNCFGDTRKVCMVQDHERLLWEERNIAALAAAKCPVVDNYPKCSPDLNAIENAWHRVRQHLEAHAPEAMETRPEFLQRLRRTVKLSKQPLPGRVIGPLYQPAEARRRSNN